MAPAATPPLTPEFRFHPDRVGFRLPWRLLPDGNWTEDRAGVPSGHAGLDALLALPGVVILSVQDDRLVLLREPGVEWSALLPAIQQVLQTHFAVPGATFVPPAVEPGPGDECARSA